jgi:hypothetical protein
VASVATQNLAEEQLQPIGPRFSEHLLRWTTLHDLAAIHEHNTVGY